MVKRGFFKFEKIVQVVRVLSKKSTKLNDLFFRAVCLVDEVLFNVFAGG